MRLIDKPPLLASFVIGLTAVISVSAQDSRPRFEVASIKPNKTGATAYGGMCHGADKALGPAAVVTAPVGQCRFINVPVEYLIHLAYRTEVAAGDREPAIVGLPGWCNSERLDVEAKAAEDSNATRAQLWEMLRSLLSERFFLEFHRVTKEVSGYRLVVVKNGQKLTESKVSERYSFVGHAGQATGRNAPVSDLRSFLAFRLDSPVTDSTGLTGTYDFRLTFSPISRNAGTSDPPGGASIFTALEEQLGLKLEKTRVSEVVYVIDSIQRPAEN